MSAGEDGLLGGYQVPEGCRDELVGADGMPLAHAAEVLAALGRLGPERPARQAGSHRAPAL